MRLALAGLFWIATAHAQQGPLDRALDERAVTDASFARRVLYTWTTPEQVERMAREHVLLWARPTLETPFNRSLAATARRRQGDPARVAQLLLTSETVGLRRYAWTTPYATRIPRSRRPYGDALVRVELRDEAWIGRYEARLARPFVFVAMDGSPVALERVLAEPERIGAIFHVRTTRAGRAFREMVLTNEAMIARFSAGDEETLTRVHDDAALLRALASGPFAALPPRELRRSATRSWLRAPSTSVDRFRATLAFDLPAYRPSPAALLALADSLAGHDPSARVAVSRLQSGP